MHHHGESVERAERSCSQRSHSFLTKLNIYSERGREVTEPDTIRQRDNAEGSCVNMPITAWGDERRAAEYDEKRFPRSELTRHTAAIHFTPISANTGTPIYTQNTFEIYAVGLHIKYPSIRKYPSSVNINKLINLKG